MNPLKITVNLLDLLMEQARQQVKAEQRNEAATAEINDLKERVKALEQENTLLSLIKGAM